jgi:hypothetical protein
MLFGFHLVPMSRFFLQAVVYRGIGWSGRPWGGRRGLRGRGERALGDALAASLRRMTVVS